ncbi:hypothetical protein LIER_15586 [Lithospermum erythrorhizon]|uniref:Uncharacterized protein n=1 Tax=Lithospermum erythrorhizon TaxID=34254 RepID=A0AAV3Q841_LITER
MNIDAYLLKKPDRPVEVSSSLSGEIYTELVDIGESHMGTDELIPLHPEAALIPKDGTSLGCQCRVASCLYGCRDCGHHHSRSL